MLRAISGLVSCCVLGCTAANAQPAAERLELWGGLTVVAPRVNSALTTSYVPVIERYSPPLDGSLAGQTVQLNSGNTTGLEGGLNYFFTDHLGVQVFLDSDRFDLSGANGDYSVLLKYTATPPPDSVPRQFSFSRTNTACDTNALSGCVEATTGSLRQLTLGFNLVGRWPMGKRVTGEVSGGLSYFDVRGNAQPLRYSVFEMGGHSTLFSEEYQLAYSVGPAHALGFNLGGSVDIEVGKGIAVVANARYFNGAELSAPVIVTDVLNKATVIFLQDATTVQQTLHPPAVSLNPARSTIMIGLKVRR